MNQSGGRERSKSVCGLLLILAWAVGVAGSQPAAPCASCLVLQVDADVLAGALDQGANVRGLRLLVAGDRIRAEAVLTRAAAAGAHGGLVVPLDASTAPLPAAEFVYLTAAAADAGATQASPLPLPAPPQDRLVFLIRTATTAARAANPRVTVALDADIAERVSLALVAAYVDAIVSATPRAVSDFSSWLRAGTADPARLSELLDRSRLGAGASVVVVVPTIDVQTLSNLAALQSALPPGLGTLDEVPIACEPACVAEVFLQPETLDAIAVLRSAAPISRIHVPVGTVHVEVAAADITIARLTGWRGNDEDVFRTGVQVEGTRTLNVLEIIARHQAQRRRQDQIVRQTIAHGSTTLLFEVPGFIAPVTITADTTLFRSPGVSDVEQRDIRVNGAAIAGGNAESPPALPLLEPERVATPPLVITLGDAYRYKLDGRERSAYVIAFEPNGARSQDSPSTDRPTQGAGDRPAATLLRGRAWIDAKTFALLRLHVVRTGLRGPIVSSEHHDELAAFDVEGETVWLTVRTEVFQMYEGAGHRTPIHRTIDTPRYEVNPADFEARLTQAYASSSLMLRETPQGYRYLLRPRGGAAQAATGPSTQDRLTLGSLGAGPSTQDRVGSLGAGREVAPRAGERVRALVFGVIDDPNITNPLPFAGLSYVDLNLFNSGAQLNAFFGGTYGQLSWSVPSIAGSRWQTAGRAFGIAARYNDRAFRAGVEQYEENLSQRPAHVSVGVVRPLSERVRWRAIYELDYIAFAKAATTASTFAVPVDALVHGLRTSLETELGRWNARIWWNPARRQRWRRWGFSSADFDPGTRDFQRYGALVTRTLALRQAFTARTELAWMAGNDLDRFSRYTFDTFEHRLRGYPSASIRYDRGLVSRTVVARTLRGWRLDGFADVALVRGPAGAEAGATERRGLRGYPGVGAAAELPGPFRTLWSVEWGYGIRGRRNDGGVGTHALRIAAYRMF